MYKVSHITIQGFWGQYVIETELQNDVNIFIGKNGTGKTTFINLLEAAISVNLDKLYSLQFTSIDIKLVNSYRSRKITITKTDHDLQFKELIYQIGTKKYKLPILSVRELKNFSSTNGRIHPKFIRETYDIKQAISELINVSFLSVSREKIFQDAIERSQSEIINTIDTRLHQLMNDLTTYQLQLETEVSKLSKKFQEDVLRSMLFNEDFDYVDISKRFDINIDQISDGLSKAYNVLGILDDKTTSIIEKHVSVLKKSSEKINQSVESDEHVPIYPNDVTPLTLIRRTEKIINLSSELDASKRKIFANLDNYINLLNNFHDTKYYTLQDSNKGTISILKGKHPISVPDLSSGEKQLLILLTETLLQRGEETLFIADEPELSLHIEWQRKIISSVKELNPNSQIILATHSPEIVGKYKKSLINMEQIVNG